MLTLGGGGGALFVFLKDYSPFERSLSSRKENRNLQMLLLFVLLVENQRGVPLHFYRMSLYRGDSHNFSKGNKTFMVFILNFPTYLTY